MGGRARRAGPLPFGYSLPNRGQWPHGALSDECAAGLGRLSIEGHSRLIPLAEIRRKHRDLGSFTIVLPQ